jgi:hypothetical protein
VKSPCAVDGETFISKINKIEKHRNLRWYIEERNRVYISVNSLNHYEKKKILHTLFYLDFETDDWVSSRIINIYIEREESDSGGFLFLIQGRKK